MDIVIIALDVFIGFALGYLTRELLTKRKQRKEKAKEATALIKEMELPPKAVLNAIAIHLTSVFSIKYLTSVDECEEFIESELNRYLDLAKELTWRCRWTAQNAMELRISYKGQTMRLGLAVTVIKRQIQNGALLRNRSSC